MKLNSIQFLRGIAALLVVYAHAIGTQMNFVASKQESIFHLREFGCIGVDLFFVISGFIITFSAIKYSGFEQGILFLKKRFWRINPAYYIASILFLCALVVPALLRNAEISLDYALSAFADTIAIFPGSRDVLQYIPLLVVGWTLSFEWLFYLLFFLLIFLKSRRKIFYLLFLITVLAALGLFLKPTDYRFIFLTNPIMLEFLLGIIICSIYFKIKKVPTSLSVFFLSLGIISYVLLIVYGIGDAWLYSNILNGQSSLKRFLLWGIPSAFIVFGCVFLEKNDRLHYLWNNEWMLLIGTASYSIYLVHITVFELLNIVHIKVGQVVPADVFIFLYLVISVAIAIGFYLVVEKPLLKFYKKMTIEEKLPIEVPSVT